MFLVSFIKGLLVGVAVSVPTGPIGFLTVKRTVTDGFGAGLTTGLGAVAADLVYGVLVIIGLRHTAVFFETYKTPMHIIGGSFLIFLGIITYYSMGRVHEQKPLFEKLNIRTGYFLTSFFVTMLNPLQVISFTALMGSLAVFHNSTNLSLVFLGGLLIGSLLWWVTLSYIVSRIRNGFTAYHIKMVNHIAGACITFSGVVILIRLVFS